ncbi:serine protease FAM111A [Alligator mississippiensis]|uniref:serine protease FAM111A n=1 Tax=Alligator mississippiensis TaxID=8496 RepID=UPI0006ECB550|nr:serine protease FAM111A [Alligator mississippiensis]
MTSKKTSKLSRTQKSYKDGDIKKYLMPIQQGEATVSGRVLRSSSSLSDRDHQTKQSPCDKSTEEMQEFTVNFSNEGTDYMVKGQVHESIYSVLMAQEVICARVAKEKGKEMHLLGKKGVEGYVNLGMPLACLPKNSHFEIKFYAVKKGTDAGETRHRQHDIKEKKCIIFYVSPTGNKLETHSLQGHRILQCQQLAKDRCNLCVFAPEGETIKDALCKDGRFLPLLEQEEWGLVENKKFICSGYTVDSLANRCFDVEVKIKRRGKTRNDLGNEQSSMAPKEVPEKTYDYFKSVVLELYPDLKKQSEMIDEFFSEAFKKGKSSGAVFKLYKENFGKETKNSTLVRVFKCLSVRSDSVGYITWDSNEGGSATCFVLQGNYILTCHHVVSLITGPGVEEKDWPLIISRSAKVTFSYEDGRPSENSWLKLAPWFEISDRDLDFAVLKLKGEPNEFPAGLLSLSYPLPFNGVIYIIGHPDGQEKSIDGCTVVPVCERGRVCNHRVKCGEKEACNDNNCGPGGPKGQECIHMFTQRSFHDVVNNPNVVTYDTSFFGGSSGSPVFDTAGQLVAMHAAGYKYVNKRQPCSIVEFGYSLVAIIAAMKEKHKAWYESEMLVLPQDYPNDVEMENGE